jgi:predicted DNA-binding transcriptional regulator YafY
VQLEDGREEDMAKSPNQKLKLLYLMKMLMEKTDETHQLSVVDMIRELDACGIAAERKTIYDDLEALRRFGLDIEQVKSKKTGYFIASREFELPEVKLLVDSVQSSKFITQKKTAALIRKIEKLTSIHEAKRLHRQVFVQNRVKSMNESVYYNVDEISNGIAGNKKIQFKYFHFTVHKEREFRRDGNYYQVSPFALVWDDENYYLIAYDSEAKMIKHYRVDKMNDISATEEDREGIDAFKALDVSAYSKKVFSMFAGRECVVRLLFHNSLAGVVIDRFGRDVTICTVDQEHFMIGIPVEISPQFFGWIFGLGCDVRILGPDHVVRQYREHLEAVELLYPK